MEKFEKNNEKNVEVLPSTDLLKLTLSKTPIKNTKLTLLDFELDWIWRLKLHPKIKSFIWLIVRDTLFTYDVNSK